MRLWAFPASDKRAQQNIGRSIANPISSDKWQAHGDKEVIDRVRASSADREVYAWGAQPGPNNERNWRAMDEGEYVLVYQGGYYTFVSRVIAKDDNEELAEAVWGVSDRNDTWRYMYFLDTPTAIKVASDRWPEYLPSKVQGFMPISPAKVSSMVAKYGSIEQFVAKELEMASEPTENPIREGLELILKTYVDARRTEEFRRGNSMWPLFGRVADTLRSRQALSRRPTVKIVDGTGQGNWARVPWIALLDSRETPSTQKGKYVVFLFREDMSGVYLAFAQGVTELKHLGTAQCRGELRRRAVDLGPFCDAAVAAGFSLDGKIDLRTSGALGKDYEASTVCYKFYPQGEVPSDTAILSDLDAVLGSYDSYLDKAATTRTWIFQDRPEHYDVRGAVRELSEELWAVTKFKDQIRPGDRVYLWESGGGGVVGVAEVTGPPRNDYPSVPGSERFVRDPTQFAKGGPQVPLRFVGPVDPSLSREEIKTTPGLEDLTIIRAPQGTNFRVTPEEAKIIENMLEGRVEGSRSDPVERVVQSLKAAGFLFPSALVKNYLLALRTKPFVLLVGMSGGGKTALSQLVAEALSEEYRAVAVKPNWTDSRDLLGFYNPITEQYVRTDALNFMLEAVGEYQRYPDDPLRYHLCLDEMNLSRVEYYFAELLSAMERPDRRITLHGQDGLEDPPASFAIPPNLVIIGTVNIDETVQPFSDKVKDRANTITVPVDITAYAEMLKAQQPPDGHSVKQKAFSFGKTPDGARAIGALLRLHGCLAKQQVHFAYRIMDEVLAYLSENQKAAYLSFEKALDFQVDQKVLPKVRGRGSAFENLLACSAGACGACVKCICESAGLANSADRAFRMAALARETGYTSYDATN